MSSDAPVVMYSTTWCGYCARLKKLLKSAHISYEEIDIEEDSAAADFVANANGGNRTVPTLKFSDGSTLTNPGLPQVTAKLAELAS